MASFIGQVEREIKRLTKERDSLDRRIRSLEIVRQEYLRGEPHDNLRGKAKTIVESRVQKMVSIIRDAGEPLHYKEIVKRLEQTGGEAFAGVKDKEKTITATLSNYRDIFKRIGKGIYALVESEGDKTNPEKGEFV